MNLLKDRVGSLYRKFLIPSLLSAMVTTVYSFVDTIAIGQGVGPDGAAAAAIIYPILGVATLFGFLCGIGGSVKLGTARGEGREEKSNAYFTTSFVLVLILTVIVWPLSIIFKEEIFMLFGANDVLMPFVMDYGNWIVWTFPVFILSAYLTCLVRSDGAPNMVMAAVVAGSVFNVFGDWFLVFPMNMGMAGAAIATAGGTAIQFIILFAYLLTKRCHLKFVKPLKFSRAIFNTLTTGCSASVLELAFIILTCILNNQIMRYGGEIELAIFGVILSCSGMFQHLFTGVGQAIQPIVSTNYGAGKTERITYLRRISITTILIMGVLSSTLGLLFPNQLISFFVKTTPEILAAAPGIVRIYFLSFLFMGINIWATFYFQSIMMTRTSTVLTILRGIIISSILIYALPILLGINGVWWAMVLTELSVAIITFFCLQRAIKKAKTDSTA